MDQTRTVKPLGVWVSEPVYPCDLAGGRLVCCFGKLGLLMRVNEQDVQLQTRGGLVLETLCYATLRFTWTGSEIVVTHK